jgi:hypothetical protein
MRRRGYDGLSQLAAGDGRRNLTLRLELANRAGIGIVGIIDSVRPKGARRITGRHSLRADGTHRMLVLASQQLMQARPQQHHPRVEDEHAGYESSFRANQHRAESTKNAAAQLNRKRN